VGRVEGSSHDVEASRDLAVTCNYLNEPCKVTSTCLGVQYTVHTDSVESSVPEALDDMICQSLQDINSLNFFAFLIIFITCLYFCTGGVFVP